MKSRIKILLFAVLLTGMVFISGCTQNSSQYCSEKFPGTVYNPSTNECDHVETPTPVPTPSPKPVTTQPTPIPTLSKNSVAYQNYKDDLREIEDLETEFAIIQSNYRREMAAAGRDVSWARALTMEYNKLEAEYEIRLNAAQARAAADFAEANGG